MVNPNLYLHIIPYTELIGGIPAIRACPLLLGRPTRIHWEPFAQNLKRSSNARAEPKRPWIRCTRSTVLSRSRSERLCWELVSAAPSCVCFMLTETVVMRRVARKDYTFADGTRIPQGTTVSINPTQAHHDPETYENPEQFEGFRFAKMRFQQGGKKHDIGMILLPPPQSSCLSETGVMPVVDATLQLASSRSCSRTPFSATK